ncbi:hypothetical protein [Natrinema sp. SYSU A 869]|uniref:hypothetical protein n=1 Tax=Natrinema sp. SYSU A 869 TaxID=2871694 RepID=UPI001CA42CF9|nr:hypothetical protein [Natrinema sp. SYSU A 869]
MQAALLAASLEQLPRVFHSEADFKQALAWALHRQFPSLTIRAEYPVGDVIVDLWLADGETTMAVELTSPTKPFEAQPADETFQFGNDPTDMGCYASLADLERLETRVAAGHCDRGVAVILTTDTLTWDNQSSGANDDALTLSDGRTVGGRLAWPEAARRRASQDRVLELDGDYTLEWQAYASQHPARASGNTAFNYGLTAVAPSAPTAAASC